MIALGQQVTNPLSALLSLAGIRRQQNNPSMAQPWTMSSRSQASSEKAASSAPFLMGKQSMFGYSILGEVGAEPCRDPHPRLGLTGSLCQPGVMTFQAGDKTGDSGVSKHVLFLLPLKRDTL